uniref:DUF4347 domain-containing protein n=1 Tax=Angiostrongylus cantonensis TaxID=6313 RepID=A0A0K0CXR1_ANGCA
MEELLEAIRNPFLIVYATILLSFCVVHGCQQLGDKVEIEFQAFRLQQFELSGNVIGSKNFRFQYEAVSLNSSALRRCIVTSWRELIGYNVDELLANSIGAVLIIIPSDLDALSPTDKALFTNLERKLATARTDLAVYVCHSSPEANAILSDVQSSSGVKNLAVQQLASSIAANTFQFTSAGSPSMNTLTYKPNNIIGIAVGADSNGSGVVVLLELLAIFRKFYEKTSTKPPFNLVSFTIFACLFTYVIYLYYTSV